MTHGVKNYLAAILFSGYCWQVICTVIRTLTAPSSGLICFADVIPVLGYLMHTIVLAFLSYLFCLVLRHLNSSVDTILNTSVINLHR